MMNPKNVLLLTSGVSGGVLELARVIREENHKSILITDTGSEQKMSAFNLFDTVIAFPLEELYRAETIIDIYTKLSVKTHIDTIISCYDPFGPAHCEILGKYFWGKKETEALKRCYFKSTVREILSTSNVDDLPFHVLKNIDDLLKIKNNIQISKKDRWILKPSFGTSSQLVSHPIESYSELETVFSESKKVLINGTNCVDVFLLEPYIEGEEYSIEGIASKDEVIIAGIMQKQGMVICNNVRSEGVNFTPIEDNSKERSIYDLIINFVKKLELKDSVFHIEARWDKKSNRPRIIEINPRLPGGLLCNIHREKHGVDLAKLLLDLRLNSNIEKVNKKCDPRIYGDLPIPASKKGFYIGMNIPDNFKVESAQYGSVELIDFLQHDKMIDPTYSEVYFAHAYIKTDSFDKFWKAVKLCEQVSAIVK